jgi:hypothetical protein
VKARVFQAEASIRQTPIILTRKTDNGLVVREIRSVGRRQVRNEKGKYEESYIKHGVGVGSPVGLGAGITNNYHHDYDRGNWNNY